jgi:hypothetical protein
MSHTYFLSFVEEFVMNSNFAGYVAGRIEVTPDDSETGYASEEIRFFTKDVAAFYAFRDKYDFEDVDVTTLDLIRATAAREFCDRVR